MPPIKYMWHVRSAVRYATLVSLLGSSLLHALTRTHKNDAAQLESTAWTSPHKTTRDLRSHLARTNNCSGVVRPISNPSARAHHSTPAFFCANRTENQGIRVPTAVQVITNTAPFHLFFA